MIFLISILSYNQMHRTALGGLFSHLDGKRSERERIRYIWADGVPSNVRLDSERSCNLVTMGADGDGNKELLAVDGGYRESSDSLEEI